MVDGYPRTGLARLNGDRPMTIKPRIRQLVHLSDGTVQLRFSQVPGADPSVFASADLIHWDALGHAREIGPGLFEFIDTEGLNSRFYRVQAE